jgi:N-acetylglucosamine kinase-like BadF-type ATPase
MTVYLGVDGGGTKTEFVLTDEAGRVIASALTGTTFHLQVGLHTALSRLAEGVDAVCAPHGLTPADIRFAFFGLPGFGEDAAVDPQIDAACGALLGHARYRCGNDMVCGWAGSLACADGINLVSGTGSIGYGERQGRAARAGGWSEIFGDEGSAYWIAIQGLNAFSRMSDGRIATGPLHQVFRSALCLDADLDICARVSGEQGMSRDAIAGLAPLVSQAADAGDSIAAAILDHAGAELALLAHALRRQLGFGADEQVRLSWSGGVLVNQQAVRAALLRHVQSAAPHDHAPYEIVTPRHEPGVGAALYAAMLARSGATNPTR